MLRGDCFCRSIATSRGARTTIRPMRVLDTSPNDQASFVCGSWNRQYCQPLVLYSSADDSRTEFVNEHYRKHRLRAECQDSRRDPEIGSIVKS
jgi:hypothetical protein